eukprot:825951-Pleurochrysis_carterae.AAC.1
MAVTGAMGITSSYSGRRSSLARLRPATHTIAVFNSLAHLRHAEGKIVATLRKSSGKPRRGCVLHA